MSVFHLSVISHQPPGGLNLWSIGLNVNMLCVICRALSLPQVLNRFCLRSGDEGAASGELQRQRRARCWGAGWPDKAVHLRLHLYPPTLLQTNRKASTWHGDHPMSPPPSASSSHFFNAMRVTPVPRVEVTGPSLAWGSWPWVECLGPWLWKTLRKAVWHWPRLSTISSWNRGAPKAFYVMSDANPELSRHNVGSEGAQPPNMVLVVLAICICGWCLHKPPSPASGSLSVSHLGS